MWFKGCLSMPPMPTEPSALGELDSDNILLFAKMLEDAIFSKSSIFIIGNGGSAANAVHIENDLVKVGCEMRARFDSALPIKAYSLCANQAVITCLANDYGYEHIFDLQLSARASHGDLLVVLSGSGNSENIKKACEKATSMGIVTFGIIGDKSGAARKMCDHFIEYCPGLMQASEDLQLVFSHKVVQLLESRLTQHYKLHVS